MFGFNWIDLIIIGFLLLATYKGYKAGLSIQLLVLAGFFGALFLGGWLFPQILPIQDKTLLTIVNSNLVLILAIYAGIRGYDAGKKYRYVLGEGKIYRVESILGIFVSIAAILTIAWLVSAMIGRLPFEGFSNSVRDSLIVQEMDQRMPPIPVLYAVMDRQINPNAEPKVFTKSSPKLGPIYSTPNFLLSGSKAKDSTVRVTSFGCGGLVSGSGFVAEHNYVITNAHVIAGVKRPIIKYKNRSYASIPVLFNPDLDFAVLKVEGLPANPLTLATNEVNLGTPVVVLGYPKGEFAMTEGVIRNNILLFGRNIYDVSVVGRQIYEVQSKVNEGSSGGPIILSDGRVAGVLFARSETNDNYGFALTSTRLISELSRAQKSNNKVSTGVCLAE